MNTYGQATEGHCVPLIAYDDTYVECITWGSLQKMNWTFFANYVTEAYIPYSPDMFKANGLTFSGYSAKGIAGLARNILLDFVRI
jgi:hypothetical protein